ncbi:hypothetical protein [Solidesulfovibrio sp.]|uniref:hypothetical protein n=1 Tax=Solidesulfovibrio sp. TaxID=2910990 RepID=UPI00261692E3|nr:hypothetical protein [Solidesulfovibrio sp.]
MDNIRLGLWGSDDLNATVKNYIGNQYYQNLPEEAHFLHSVAKILGLRYARDKEGLHSAPSMYILNRPPIDSGVEFKREHTFSLGVVDVSGKIWFGSSAMNSSNGASIPEGIDIDSLFTYVSRTLNSGEQPAIYYDVSASEKTFRFYPKGVENPDNCTDIRFVGQIIDERSLKSFLDRIHNRHLLTPTASFASNDLWENKIKCYPIKQAERGVQSILQICLAEALGNIQVKCEGTGVFGRYDLSILEQDPLEPSKFTIHAILELKVVKKFTHTGHEISDNMNKKAVLKGFKQAFAYRHEHHAKFSALCCYDMRPSPTLHKHSEKKCKIAIKLGIEFWAWPLFSTPDAARDWLVENTSPKEPS